MTDDIRILAYDNNLFPFRNYFSDIFGTADLENLHAIYGVTSNNISEKTIFLRDLCERRICQLQDLISKFMQCFVAEQYGKVCGFQMLPTLRFHFAVKDSELDEERIDIAALDSQQFLRKYYFDKHRLAMFHRDKDYGLLDGSVNLWIPVTKVWGANTLWLGGRHHFGIDAVPMELNYGDALFFDGAMRWHGVVWNTTDITRVSFDIRFQPEKSYFQKATFDA